MSSPMFRARPDCLLVSATRRSLGEAQAACALPWGSQHRAAGPARAGRVVPHALQQALRVAVAAARFAGASEEARALPQGLQHAPPVAAERCDRTWPPVSSRLPKARAVLPDLLVAPGRLEDATKQRSNQAQVQQRSTSSAPSMMEPTDRASGPPT